MVDPNDTTGETILTDAFRHLCSPGDHHEKCPRTPDTCPHVEAVSDATRTAQ